MPSFAMTLPYMRTSPIHVPRRDLVLGRADSLFLHVTVVDRDSPYAGPLDLSGGIGGPALQMLVWPDQHHRNSWDYGGYWHWPQCPQTVLWVGTGVQSPYPAIGAFDIAFPTSTMAGWPRRCAYALQLDYDGGGGTDLLAEGRLQLTHSVARSVNPVIMLTDPNPATLTDPGEAIYLAGEPSP
jgi:hypothetical protein